MTATKGWLEAQGVVIESIDLSQPDEMHIGQSFRLCFVPVRVHGKAFDIRCQVDIYFIAFARNGTEDWYLLHGGNITPDMFHTILPGFPPTLEFPEIRRTVFED